MRLSFWRVWGGECGGWEIREWVENPMERADAVATSPTRHSFNFSGLRTDKKGSYLDFTKCWGDNKQKIKKCLNINIKYLNIKK